MGDSKIKINEMSFPTHPEEGKRKCLHFSDIESFLTLTPDTQPPWKGPGTQTLLCPYPWL